MYCILFISILYYINSLFSSVFYEYEYYLHVELTLKLLAHRQRDHEYFGIRAKNGNKLFDPAANRAKNGNKPFDLYNSKIIFHV